MEKNEFYDSLATDYDEMIDFEKSLEKRIKLLSNFTRNHFSVLDFGCGTGIDSIALAKLGLQVDAFDISEKMIDKAKLNARKKSVSINFFSEFSRIECSGKQYDLIISLGNTLANIPVDELKKRLNSFHQLLSPKGKMVFQIINYIKINDADTFLIAEKETKNHVIKRYYEKTGTGLNFIIRIENRINKQTQTLLTKIYPHTPEIFREFYKSGNYNITFFGNMKLDKFEPQLSNDLVIYLEKL